MKSLEDLVIYKIMKKANCIKQRLNRDQMKLNLFMLNQCMTKKENEKKYKKPKQIVRKRKN